MNILNRFLISTALVLAPVATLAAEADNEAITATLELYETALNSGDVQAIAALYTADGVQMAPGFPAAVGTPAIEASYTGTFQAISVDLDFTVDEIKLLGPETALLRSHSAGTLAVNGNGQPAGPAAFKELFLLQKQDDGAWKFTHYSFSDAGAQ